MNVLFDEIMSKAKKMGYERAEVADRFLSYMACGPQDTRNHNVMVVACNRETAEHLARSLEKELKVHNLVGFVHCAGCPTAVAPGKILKRIRFLK